MSSSSSHSSDSAELQQGTIQRYLLRTSSLDSRTGKDKLAASRTPGKSKPPSLAHMDSSKYKDATGEPSAPSMAAMPLDTPSEDGPAELFPPASGGSAGSATTALLSAFRADFESWASKMEASLHVELQALQHRVSTTENAVSVLATTQDDHAARIVALESATTSHLSRLRQHQLRIEDSENRSRRNNIRIQGVPEATSGTDLKPTVVSILNQVLGREVTSPIELDRVHRVGGMGGDRSDRPRDVLCRVHYYTLKEEIMRKAWRLGPVEFDGSTVHLYPDLSRNTLYMRRAVRPLLDLIRQAGASYTWGHPFSIKVTRDDNCKFVLSDPEQLPAFFTFLAQDPISIPNWLDPPEDRQRLQGPLPQRRRRSRSRSASFGPRARRPTSPED